MPRLHRALGRRVAPDALVAHVVRLACFAAAPAVLVVAIRAATRLASTPGEVLLGVLGGSAVALLLVLVGLVLPIVARSEEEIRAGS